MLADPVQAEIPAGAREIREAAVRVVFWPGQEDLARRTLGVAARPPGFPGIPDDPALTAGTIYLAPSPEHFHAITGGRVPEWGAGVAIPARRVIVLPTYPRAGGAPWDGTVTLRHELAHLAVHAYLPAPVPRWFDEGYATWVSGGWDQGSAWQIRAAFLLGQAPMLDSLTLAWPRGEEQARLAYLLSASAVRYLMEIGGEAGFATFLAEWRTDGDFERALRRVYGMTSGQFEAAWRRMVRQRYGWLLALSQITIFWTGAGLLLFVLYGIRRRRQRAQLERLEEADRHDAELLAIDEAALHDRGAPLEADAPAAGGDAPSAGDHAESAGRAAERDGGVDTPPRAG